MGRIALPLIYRPLQKERDISYDLSVFVLGTPGNREYIQMSNGLLDPWAVYPSVVLTDPLTRKSHHSVKLHRLTSEAIRCLQAGLRSDRSIVVAFLR